MALKLGKATAFVKSRLKRLPRDDDVWEADFLREIDSWMGMVIEQEYGFVFAMKTLATTPTVNDLAHLLADAMQRPLVEVRSHRPQNICLRENPDWRELVPHLEDLRIKIVFTGDLATWDNAAADYQSPAKKRRLSLRDQPSIE